jgi:hypothetical protein
MWAILKTLVVARKVTSKLQDIQELAEDKLSRTAKSEGVSLYKHVKDNRLQNFIVRFGLSDSDSSINWEDEDEYQILAL